MVATRLLDVSAKGKNWYYGSTTTTTPTSSVMRNNNDDNDKCMPQQVPNPNDNSTSSSSYGNYLSHATESLQQAAETTYSSLAHLLSNIIYPEKDPSTTGKTNTLPYIGNPSIQTPTTSYSQHGIAKRDVFLGMFSLQNPYQSVRGRIQPHITNDNYAQRRASMSAVRSLLSLVPQQSSETANTPLPSSNDLDQSYTEYGNHPSIDFPSNRRNMPPYSDAETATQIAEGTIRAVRDVALDEAVELHVALRYWSSRWERPVLSWLEAGPWVWFSQGGYNHQEVGRKVAQIQAVLARRCASIGELQQHLLRAGWQKGVAQWGVLGQGGQWAAVGFDGAMPPERPPLHRTMSSDIGDVRIAGTPTPRLTSKGKIDTADEFSFGSPLLSAHISGDSAPPARGLPLRRKSFYRANVLVKRGHGGGIFTDDPSFLAEWSVEAIALVRRQLLRASNGTVALPCEDNWKAIVDGTSPLVTIGDEEENDDDYGADQQGRLKLLPVWASQIPLALDNISEAASQDDNYRYTISDLPSMAGETAKILDMVEDVMEMQKRRRLDRLREPGWLQRNWFIAAGIIPPLALFSYRFARHGFGREFLMDVSHRIGTFFSERVKQPVFAIIEELWKGRERFSDKKARIEATETLKDMIRSWLDDFYPQMPNEERARMAKAMDMSLIERKKEESMKTFYEINNVIRMSFIEMQYMKTEMMNALEAMDEMMSANDINMNIAAITPVVLLAYFQARIFRFLFYALLKLGKSREETYSSFRDTLLEIERLLVMRDNPPPPTLKASGQVVSPLEYEKSSVLGSDDLGMLMLLIHELRTTIFRDSRRFSLEVIRSLTEDLAELAGERGAVSVRQQLRIVSRMVRTYKFLGHDHGH